ncbi:MAG: site-specific integrase [Proteobacteria bacterium]|nr:MAG: site-specific integrase [Pseudomonadota bacterium]
MALKRACRGVLAKWAQFDRLIESASTPEDPKDALLYRHAQHFRAMQDRYGKVLPAPSELRNGVNEADFKKRTGLSMKMLRETAFPTRFDADATYHLCLCNMGWNPSTLLSLDVSQKFLFTHPKDDLDDPHKRFVLSPETYTLTGNKVRSGNKEQIVVGQWKTQEGPGNVIRTYIERTVPLRKLLEMRLLEAKRRYAELVGNSAPYGECAKQFEGMQRLEQGCRSIWLYIDNFGDIVWLGSKQKEGHINNEGKKTTFVAVVINQLNEHRAQRNELMIPHVTPSDFRDFFATYVWRASGGSILAVKRALGHAQLRTSADYLDNNVLNQEADDAARSFLNVLVDELGKGRVDLTLLSHLHRHGAVTPEMKQRLVEHRALARSRMKIACRDPRNPPPQIRTSGKGLCDDNRCLMCPENAVLLPESYDGIAMRVEEILALQANLPIETWISADYPLELKNNLAALRLFDMNLVLTSRQRWAAMIVNGKHNVPGAPIFHDELEIK